MDIRMVVIELAEKIGLLATAGLLAVLVPPMRNRLLGVGRPRDRLVAVLFGIFLAMWGAKMGDVWLGYHVNTRAIGVFIAAALGGTRAGVVCGVIVGLFYVFRVQPDLSGPLVDAGLVGIVASTLQGLVAGMIVDRKPRSFLGWNAFPTSVGVQVVTLVLVGLGVAVAGKGAAYYAAWPAMLVQLVGSAAGITLFLGVARLVLAREESAVQLVEARAAADTFELQALRRRLEPHFLFNALNTLRATIRKDPKQARELVSDLADLYRYLLHHPEDAPLASEVAHACAYLAIERARLGEGRLSVETDVPEELGELRVPALLLQPLVENAVKHGVAARDGAGMVRLVAKRDDDALVIEVCDRGSGRPLGAVTGGSGIALDTLRERLGKRFEGEATLELAPSDGGMCARIRLPMDELEGQSTRSAA